MLGRYSQEDSLVECIRRVLIFYGTVYNIRLLYVDGPSHNDSLSGEANT